MSSPEAFTHLQGPSIPKRTRSSARLSNAESASNEVPPVDPIQEALRIAKKTQKAEIGSEGNDSIPTDDPLKTKSAPLLKIEHINEAKSHSSNSPRTLKSPKKRRVLPSDEEKRTLSDTQSTGTGEDEEALRASPLHRSSSSKLE